MSQPRTPAEVLLEARQKASLKKRSKVLAVVEEMLTNNQPITFAAVHRAAGVSNWLVYAPGVREHIERAQRRQEGQPRRDTESGMTATDAGLKTDLALARAEITRLRSERDQLQAAVQRHLGHQLEQHGAADLVDRINELTAANHNLTEQLSSTQQANADLRNNLTEALDDLAAARRSLRKMIRAENHPEPPA